MHFNYVLEKVSYISGLQVKLQLLRLDLRIVHNVADHRHQVLRVSLESLHDLLHVGTHQGLRDHLAEELCAGVYLCQRVPKIMNHSGHVVGIIGYFIFE